MINVIELYEIYILEGFLEPRYALFVNNSLSTITINNKSYYPYPIGRNNIDKDLETGERVSISMLYHEPLLRKLHEKISYYVGLNLYFYIDDEAKGEYVRRIFSGFCRNYQIQNNMLIFEFRDIYSLIQKSFPRFYTSINCCCSFGDKICGINKDNYKISFNIENNKDKIILSAIENKILIYPNQS